MSVKMPTVLTANRLVQENYEDRQYRAHLKKLNDIKNSKSPFTFDPLKLPSIQRNKKDLAYLAEIEYETQKSTGNLSKKRAKSSKVDTWYLDFHKSKKEEIEKATEFRNSKYQRERERDIAVENMKLLKKLQSVKPTYNRKEWEKDFITHQSIVHSNGKKLYTPRGIGHRKFNSLQIIADNEQAEKKNKKKSNIKMLNAAVNRTDAADIVLIKTLATLNYYERMETKKKYEETYQSDLKKGLLKVMDKGYEPLIHALLSDKNIYDAERIYEALYDPNDAALVICEALLSRYLSERDALFKQFKQTIDSSLETEIEEKIEGDLKNFLLNFLQNRSLDSSSVDYELVKNDIDEMIKLDVIPSDSEIILESIKGDSRKQMKLLFDEFKKTTDSDLSSKFDCNKPVGKAIKFIESYLNNSHLHKAEKLHANVKANKSEFLRLLALYPKNQLRKIKKEYNQKYKVSIEEEIKNSYSEEISRIALKISETE